MNFGGDFPVTALRFHDACQGDEFAAGWLVIAQSKRPEGLKPEIFPSTGRGPKGPLFHGCSILRATTT